MCRSTLSEIRGAFFTLCIMSLIFHFLVRQDIHVDTDISRYIQEHELFRIPTGVDSVLSNMGANVLPISFHSTILGPRISMTRGLRGAVSSGLQRFSTSQEQHPEEKSHGEVVADVAPTPRIADKERIVDGDINPIMAQEIDKNIALS